MVIRRTLLCQACLALWQCHIALSPLSIKVTLEHLTAEGWLFCLFGFFFSRPFFVCVFYLFICLFYTKKALLLGPLELKVLASGGNGSLTFRFWFPEFSKSGRREPVPQSCPLTSAYHPPHHAHSTNQICLKIQCFRKFRLGCLHHYPWVCGTCLRVWYDTNSFSPRTCVSQDSANRGGKSVVMWLILLQRL